MTMTRRPPRRLVARGRFPLGRICREVPSVMDRSAFLGPGGGISLSPLARVSAALLLPHKAGACGSQHTHSPTLAQTSWLHCSANTMGPILGDLLTQHPLLLGAQPWPASDASLLLGHPQPCQQKWSCWWGAPYTWTPGFRSWLSHFWAGQPGWRSPVAPASVSSSVKWA